MVAETTKFVISKHPIAFEIKPKYFAKPYISLILQKHSKQGLRFLSSS